MTALPSAIVRKFRSNAKELAALREIFNLSSKSSSDESYERWTSYYYTHTPQWIYVVERGEVLGYLMAAPDSEAAREHYTHRVKSFAVFADLFPKFPAHFHINCHPKARGQGLGSLMIQALLADLKGVGVHLVTSPTSANRTFYARNGFTFEVERPFNEHRLLFMGFNPSK